MSKSEVKRFNEGEHKGCLDLTGIRYGKLVTKHLAYKGEQGAVWLCECDCGETSHVAAKILNYGVVKSCGCSKGWNTHGKSYNKEYKSWRAMKSRCLVQTTYRYEDYGGRGIGVDQRWIDSFEAFYSDMGECPEGMSLDRVDVNGNYCKENCRWANQSMQVFNTRLRSVNTSGKTGVSLHDGSGKWRARINVNGVEKHLGLFYTFEEAVSARQQAELDYFGFTKE